MKITDLIIDPKSLGNKFWLTDVAPVYQYQNNKRTDVVTAYRYTICLPERNLDKINVKIDGKALLESPQGYAEVRFGDLSVFIYWLNGKPEVGARASNVTLVNQKG